MESIYFSVKDIMEILSYSQSKAYTIIRELNKELQAKGYLIRPGMVPKKYFWERMGIK